MASPSEASEKAMVPPPSSSASSSSAGPSPQNEMIGGGLKATVSGWLAKRKKTAVIGVILGLLYAFMFRYVKAKGIDSVNPNGENPNKGKIMQMATKLKNKNK